MANKMRVEQQFECSAKGLYDLLTNEEFDQKLMANTGVGREVLEQEDLPDGKRLKLKMSPKVELPGFMAKLVGGRNDYVEERIWNDKTLSNTWKILPAISPDKVNIGGTVTVKDLGGGKCARIIEGDFEVRVALVGGKIEKFIISQTEDSFKKGEAFIRQYIKDNGIT